MGRNKRSSVELRNFHMIPLGQGPGEEERKGREAEEEKQRDDL